jgi:uncharacterized protein involved in exopolysaccharide biosynthesis
MHASKLLTFLCALFIPLGGHADPQSEAEARRLEATLARIQQTQAGVYQQFQMAQELRRVEMAKPDPTALPSSPQVSTEPLDYNELQRLRAERAQRIKDLDAEIERLYARYRELEAQKEPLLNRLGELTRTP